MSEKKERILNTALELFANEGYNAVSTSRIARRAGVSEGLIFRHFGNKKGLLDALMQEVEGKLGEVFRYVLTEEDPREVIRQSLRIPFVIEESEHNFWKLQFKLKWEDEYNNPRKMEPILDKWIWAFDQLGYEKPAFEATLLNQIIDAVSIGILRDGQIQDEQYLAFLLDHYLV